VDVLYNLVSPISIVYPFILIKENICGILMYVPSSLIRMFLQPLVLILGLNSDRSLVRMVFVRSPSGPSGIPGVVRTSAYSFVFGSKMGSK
jgi:hypothetical protein